MMKSSGDILRSGGHIFYTKRRGSGSGRTKAPAVR